MPALQLPGVRSFCYSRQKCGTEFQRPHGEAPYLLFRSCCMKACNAGSIAGIPPLDSTNKPTGSKTGSTMSHGYRAGKIDGNRLWHRRLRRGAPFGTYS